MSSPRIPRQGEHHVKEDKSKSHAATSSEVGLPSTQQDTKQKKSISNKSITNILQRGGEVIESEK